MFNLCFITVESINMYICKKDAMREYKEKKIRVIYYTLGEFWEKYSWTACKIRQLRLFFILLSKNFLITSLFEWGRDFDLVYLTFNGYICIMVNIM